MKTLTKSLENQINALNVKSSKLEVNYNYSKREENDFWGDDKIYAEMKKIWDMRDLLVVTLEKVIKF
jgi:hypothetical protein